MNTCDTNQAIIKYLICEIWKTSWPLFKADKESNYSYSGKIKFRRL